jgi:4-hydroxy-3-methylbut-2-enyl diphosphate reductase
MNIIKINPQGFCNGVINAIKKVNNVVNDPNTIKPIYLLGMLIHNKFVCDELENKGVVILKDKPLDELIDSVDNGTIIISAHGVSNSIKDQIINKGLNMIDATCPIVNNVHLKIFKYLELGYDILYIGKDLHPETIGVLGESDKIILIDSLEKINTLDKNKKYYVTNQTTLSNDYILKFHEYIKENLNDVILENNICNATTKREIALYDLETDLIIVVGDPKSSNTKKLVDVAKEKSKALDVIFIESAMDLINFDFSKFNTIHVTSGASTPNEITDQVIRYIKTKDKNIVKEKLLLI